MSCVSGGGQSPTKYVVCVQASPLRRDPYGETSLADGIEVTTICYRAPEVLFGNVAFGAAIDVWALGLVIFEAGGATFHRRPLGRTQTQVDYMQMLFGQLGTPTCQALICLPHFPKAPIKKVAVPWSEDVVQALSPQGVAFAAALLRWDPGQRPHTGLELSEHPFLCPGRLWLGGSILSDGGDFEKVGHPAYSGKRHLWNALEGQLSREMLEYLQGDPVLDTASEEHKALSVKFHLKDGQVKDAKSEVGRKFVKSGFMGLLGPSSSACCNLSLDKPLPILRSQTWFEAFCTVNRGVLEALRVAGKRRLYRLSEENRGRNGNHFMALTAEQWFAKCGELCVTVPKMPDGSYWAEPEHSDGGASVLHLGLTLFGRRHVRCSQEGDGPDIYLQCRPGSLYMGGFTGPVHQVFMSSQKLHSPASDWGLGSVAVSSGVYLCSCVCLFVGPWSLACSSLWFPAGSLVTCCTVLYGLGVVAFTGCFSGGGMAICTTSVFGVVSVRICSCFRSCCFAGPARGGSFRGDAALAWPGGEAGLGDDHDADSLVSV